MSYLAPLGVAVLILVASLIGAIHLPAMLRDASLDPAKQHELIEQPYVFAALLLMFTTLVVGIFYCVDALQGERRDRSILFWKSLPVSDVTTVLAKTSIPFRGAAAVPLYGWPGELRGVRESDDDGRDDPGDSGSDPYQRRLVDRPGRARPLPRCGNPPPPLARPGMSVVT